MVSGKLGVILLVVAVVGFLALGGGDVARNALKEVRKFRDETLLPKDKVEERKMGGQSN